MRDIKRRKGRTLGNLGANGSSLDSTGVSGKRKAKRKKACNIL